ncbi:MAG: ABC transporter permease [Gammaproteobacteria bacterium]|nr:ABC transporter permease [Gammaproteobacteria bacterium]
MAIVRLALKSLWNRRGTAALTVLAIALSVTLLLGVEKLRREAREGFASTISGTDLIVGARGGAVQLLLYSVFHIGDATSNISWRSYRDIASSPRVAWTIPISLGDSHRGYRVMGTDQAFFEHYRYGRKRAVTLAEGRAFSDVFEAVLGAEVAAKLGYRVGDEITVAHGMGELELRKHDDKPFRVSGILAATSTPLDRAILVSLEGIEAMHADWRGGVPVPGMQVSADEARAMSLEPETITAFLVGLESRIDTFRVQRAVNEYRREALLAILPGVALHQLWDLMSVAENALRAVSVLVVATGLMGMLTAILTGLNERRREMAILRSVGARPGQVFGLLVAEALAFAVIGALLGVALMYVTLLGIAPWLEARFGLFLSLEMLDAHELLLLGLVLVAASIAGSVPAYRAYRYSLADGMSPRI